MQLEPTGSAQLTIFLGEHIQQFTHREDGDIRRQHAGIQPRDIDQRAQQTLDICQRAPQPRHQLAGRGDALRSIIRHDVRNGITRQGSIQRQPRQLLFQGAGKQPSGIQGLQQVMADGGEKAGLGVVGRLGGGLGGGEASIECPQLIEGAMQGIGALAHLIRQQHRMFEGGVGRAR